MELNLCASEITFLPRILGANLNQTSKVLLRFGRTRHRQADANLKPLRIEI
jgi:hypothetical protein